MARGIKLTDSVSISELMHMREVEGLSNGEIARRLGVHINTICKAIGPHPDGKRAKHKRPTRTAEKLPALPEKQIPDMPRESFKERCERLMARVEESPAPIATLMASTSARAEDAVSAANQPKMHYNYLTPPKEGWGDDEDEAENIPTEADKAREAHCKEMAVARAAGDKMAVYRKSGDPKDIPHDATLGEIAEAHHINVQEHKSPGIISELLAVFGPDIVRDYLRVSLYAMGIPYCKELKRDYLLTALKLLNGEEIRID